MRNTERQFPIEIRTGWVDYSPALRYHASRLIRSRLTEFAAHIRLITVRFSSIEPHNTVQRRCDIELITAYPEAISASSVGVGLFTLAEQAVDTVVEKLRQRIDSETGREFRQRVA